MALNMNQWYYRVELIPKVTWHRFILPEEPKVMPINAAETEKNWRETNNRKQETICKRYIGQSKIKAKLERMAARGEIVVEGDTIKRKVA